MAIREAIVTIPDTRDPIVGVDPSSGKLVQWDGEKWVDASEEAIGYTAEQMASLNNQINNATTLVKALDKAQKKLEEGLFNKADLNGIQYLLDSLKKGSVDIAGGLLLTNDIILSEPSDGRVTAALSGSAVEGHKALRLGIVDTNTELTALHNDGTGHLGQLHFDGDRIVVAPIGDITAAFMEFGRNVMRQTIQEVLATNALDTTQALPNLIVSNGSEVVNATFNIANDATLVTITMTLELTDELAHDDPRGEKQYLYKIGSMYLDDSQSPIETVHAELEMFVIEIGGENGWHYPYTTKEVSYICRLRKGVHTLTWRTNFGAGRATNIKVRQQYTTNYRQTSFSDRGMRIYGGANSLVDFNHDHPAGTMFAMIRGGLDVDEIKLANGGFYAGGVINSFGSMTRWVGKKLIVAKISTGRYRITHNVGSDQYVIQAIPVNTDDWNAFVIKGSENTTSVEIGVMWSSGWRDGPIHFSIFAR